ncbi:uncharacterized protein JN550_009337 [Neoarthrinium moseri]|uniref:uncharacterized protein n=1 Tax=Neoarthrinium moseri TaxID=1658444 RepID=UPI001FDE7F0F|nr:uncharacterized protein JN550_009337 [Neoarthrinium moseri]KAI1863839.1 hypothetical protein JN550_009337 [Neoarthrinium moseri]
MSRFYHRIQSEEQNFREQKQLIEVEIADTVLTIIEARENAKKGSDDSIRTKLAICADVFISLRGDTNALKAKDHLISLNRLTGTVTQPKKDVIWPPAFINKEYTVIMAQKDTHKKLHVISRDDPGDAPNFPHDQSSAFTLRHFLCSQNLAENKTNAAWALYCAPVAFLSHEARVDWHRTIGHKSRFFATVPEFLAYAKAQLTGQRPKEFAACILTPWFFGQQEIAALARQKDQAIPTAWEKRAFRAGMMMVVVRDQKFRGHVYYKVILFKPAAPHYTLAQEPAARRSIQDQWIEDLKKSTKECLGAISGDWIGGILKHRDEGPKDRNVKPDSVELSSAFITEIIEQPGSLPTQP